MNTPSPEQTQKEGLYEHYQGSNLRWYVRLGTIGPVYEYQFEHEAINARICLNAAFQAGVAHVQAQAAPVADGEKERSGPSVEEVMEALRLAIKYIQESPCDPDIYDEQIKAWSALNDNPIAAKLLSPER